MSLKRKQCPCKPGSVPLRASVIYLLRWLPSVSSILPSIVSRRTRTDSPPTMVYANLQPPDGTALRLPAGWWSLTPPSHPYPFGGRLFSSPVSCCHQQLALSPVERPMLPGLSSRTLICSTSDRPLHCFYMFCFSRFSDHDRQPKVTLLRHTSTPPASSPTALTMRMQYSSGPTCSR